MIEAFCRVMRWPPSFWLPVDPRELEFLFLPSDVQYCGPNGPKDRDYDPRHAPVADDSYIQVRALIEPISPPRRDAELPVNARPPVPQSADEDWFPGPRLDSYTYNYLARLAIARDQDALRVSRVDQGQVRSRNFLVADVWGGLPSGDPSQAAPAGPSSASTTRATLPAAGPPADDSIATAPGPTTLATSSALTSGRITRARAAAAAAAGSSSAAGPSSSAAGSSTSFAGSSSSVATLSLAPVGQFPLPVPLPGPPTSSALAVGPVPSAPALAPPAPAALSSISGSSPSSSNLGSDPSSSGSSLPAAASRPSGVFLGVRNTNDSASGS